MLARINTIIMIFCLLQLTACISDQSKKITGPRKVLQENLYVSVENLPVLTSPSAFSEPITVLSYATPLNIKRQIVVIPHGVEHSQKIPKWGVLDCNGEKGYIPMSSIVSEWLINNQDPNLNLDRYDSRASIRGFSEEERADLVAMRGVVGNAKGSGPDYNTLSKVLNARLPDNFAKELAQSGDISMDKPMVELNIINIENTRFAATQSLRRGLSSVLQHSDLALGVFGREEKSSERIVQVAQAGSSLVYNEIGPLQEYIIGRAIAARLLGESPPTNIRSEPYRYLQAIGEVVSKGSSYPYPFEGYNFILIQGDEPNAFAAPGGFIFVTDGMLAFLESEDELAAILGHEIAHVELGHGMQAVNQERLLSLFGVISEIGMDELSSSLGNNLQQIHFLQKKAENLLEQVVDEMLNAIRQGYSREIEAEADKRSIEISAVLGYDTMSLYNILERFKSVRGDYGGASYPKERGEEAKMHQQLIDPTHRITTSNKRTIRYRKITSDQ